MFKPVCSSCHFFVRQYRNERGAEHTLEINDENRRKAQQGEFTWQRESESLRCFKGIWDQGHPTSGLSLENLVSKQSRRGKCYFFKFQPGMLLPAAEKLQQERSAAALERQKYRLAIYALALTIAGLTIKLIYDRVA